MRRVPHIIRQDMITSKAADRALKDAMDWLMQVRDAPADAALRARVEAWIAADAAHARAWDQARLTWQLLGRAPIGRAAPVAAPVVRRRPMRGAFAAMAACLLLVFAPALTVRLQADHATGIGETRRVGLEDGSAIHLAPQSAVRTSFADTRRTVELLAGEAFFEVVRDPARPFVVTAKGLDARVLGTAFDVRIGAETLTVGVQSGAVGVGYGGGVLPVAAKLGPGERIVVSRNDGTARRDGIPPADIAAWRDGRLFFADTPVAEVVDELRRYHPGWIVVASDRLAAERVTGLYDPGDPDRALRALVRPAGGQVREVTPFLHVLSLP